MSYEVIDPNSAIPTAFEARVTRRGVRLTDGGKPVQVSTRSDFIAPELSAPSTLAVEQSKGLRGWTDHEVKVPESWQIAAAKSAREAQAAELLDSITVGSTVIRHRAASTARPTYNPGASKRRRSR